MTALADVKASAARVNAAVDRVAESGLLSPGIVAGMRRDVEEYDAMIARLTDAPGRALEVLHDSGVAAGHLESAAETMNRTAEKLEAWVNDNEEGVADDV